MVSRNELLNDPEEAIRAALDGRQSTMWTAMPAVVQSVDLAAMTCEVQPSIRGYVQDENGETKNVDYPLLVDVPILFPAAGGFALTFPIAAGDEVLVVFASRCIDSWWQSGGTLNRPMEARMHDLSDGFAIPGPFSQPRVLDAISSSAVQLRNTDGTVYLSIGTDKKIKLVSTTGKFHVANTVTDLKTVLTDLEALLNTFLGALAAFSGGGAPTTQAMLQGPAATAVGSLATVLVKINALLE